MTRPRRRAAARPVATAGPGARAFLACMTGLVALLCGLLVALGTGPAAAAPSVPATATAAPPPPGGVRLPCAEPRLRGSLPPRAAVPRISDLTRAQARRLHGFVVAGHRRDAPARAQALALMTAVGVADDDVPRSRVGRDAAWLTPQRFYERLERIDDWELLPPALVGHRVLGSPDPFVLEPYWDHAVGLLARLARLSPEEANVSVGRRFGRSRGCASRATDLHGFPLPAGTGYRVAGHEHHEPGARDTAAGSEALLEVACGNPVLAAVPGKARVLPGTAGSGPWQVEVRRGDGAVVRYSHVSRPTVRDGQTVFTGEPLAEVGDLGDVDDCGLGLEVRGDDGVLPHRRALAWLASPPVTPGAGPGGPGTRPGQRPEPEAPTSPTTFRMASFNVLGAHLTGPGSDRPGYRPGPVRMAEALALLEAHSVSVVVLNEFESPQAAVVAADADWRLHRATPNVRFRDGNATGNAVAWRAEHWRLVHATEFTVPWQVVLHMPVVTLEHRTTGARIVVVGVHNPASTSRQGDQSGARSRARAIERQQVAAIHAQTGLPVVLAGDFNERAEALCWFTGGGLMTTWTDGAGSCSGYGYGGVDFVFGTAELDFQDRVVDRSTLGRISDHPLVSSLLYLPPQG